MLKRGIVLLLILPLIYADYYVSPTGSAAWSECSDIATPCSLSTANSNADAGDTVMMRAGSYNSRISPSNSGTATSRITYKAYNNEEVTITQSEAISFTNKQYITVDGIFVRLNSCSGRCYVFMDNSNNNIIENCVFDQITNPSGWPNGLYLKNNAHHNIFRNNKIGNAGYESSGPQDAGGTMRFGHDAGNDGSGHNLFEGNELFNGGHHVIEVYTNYNIFRNNLIHNDDWYPCSQPGGKCGNRNLIFDGPGDDASWNILENNRIAFAGIPADSVSGSGISLRSGDNIIRHNAFYHSTGPAMSIEHYGYWGEEHDVSFNHIYNNVFYHNGYFQQDGWWAAHYGMLIADQDWSGIQDLKIKNNIWWENQAGPIAWSHSTDRADQEFANNLEGVDPKFVNTNTDGPDSWVLPDLSLQTDSPAIDTGGELTFVSVADTSTGTELIVDDAGYFQDGSWFEGEMDADWIAVGAVDNIAQIDSIDYSTNTITLINSIDRADNNPVYLYKDSDGTRVLYGTLPDIGAYEYDSGAPLVINGICGSTNNSCISGTFSDIVDNSTHILWQCTGTNGGTTVSCSLLICVSTTDILRVIDDWKSGAINMHDLMQSIKDWKDGC